MFASFLSYVAALSLTALAVYAVSKKRTAANTVLSIALLLLAGIEVIGDVSLRLSDFDLFRQISLVLESLLPGPFLLLTLLYGRTKPFKTQSRTRMALTAVLALVPVTILIWAETDLYFSPDFQTERVLFLGDAGYWFYLAIMASLITSLVNIEATLTATQGLARNRMKFESLGIISLLSVLIFYYSQALLYRTINMNLVPVRSTIFIIGASLIGYSQAFRGNGTRVAVSRHIFYRSITVLVVGVYFITLGLIGEGMRYFGGSFGSGFTIVLAFAGGILLFAILFSEKVRRRVKVYIYKNFYANKHDYREEWIKLTAKLSSCRTLSDVQETILSVYRDTFGLAGASLYLVTRDGKQYRLAAEQAMETSPPEIRLSDALRDYFLQRERVLNVTDGEYRLSSSQEKLFRQARAWLGVPLVAGRKIEGLLLLREQIVSEGLIYDDYDLMKVLARQAAQAIANIRLSEEIMEMRTIAAVARISSFVIHDLKNLTSGLSLVVDNAEQHIGNPDFQQDAIATIKNTLLKMRNLMQRLKSIPEKTALEAKVEDIDRVSRDTIAEMAKIRSRIRIEYQGSPVFASIDEEEIRKVIINLVQNSLEASDEKGTVKVMTSEEDEIVRITISDVGIGMTEDFLKNHLFRPFQTTKEKGLGIGLYQCRQIVEAHGGSIEVTSEINKGTSFTICLPSAEPVHVMQ